MKIKTFVVGQMAVNCYFLIDEKSLGTIIVDPGDEASYLSGEIEKEHLHPEAIIATHGHFDHILAALELTLMYNIPFKIHEKDAFLLARMSDSAKHFLGREIFEFPPKPSSFFYGGETISVGNSAVSVINTPGHTPGSISLYDRTGLHLLVGDVLFSNGGIGRTDFAYSDQGKLQRSIKLLLGYPEKTRILSGHGDATTVGMEKAYLSPRDSSDRVQ